MMEIGMDLGTEGIAEDGGAGRTLLEIHRRSVSDTISPQVQALSSLTSSGM